MLSKELEAGKETLTGVADNPAQLSVETQVLDFPHCPRFTSSSALLRPTNTRICVSKIFPILTLSSLQTTLDSLEKSLDRLTAALPQLTVKVWEKKREKSLN